MEGLPRFWVGNLRRFKRLVRDFDITLQCPKLLPIMNLTISEQVLGKRPSRWGTLLALALGVPMSFGAAGYGRATVAEGVVRSIGDPILEPRCADLEYFVAFVSREASNGSRAGHAFVIIGKGTPMTCDVEHGDGEAFGFYPSSESNPCQPGSQPTGKDILLKPVPGCLIDDLYTPYSSWLTVKCSFEEYLMVFGVVEEWKKRPYRLGRQDCLSFLTEVANLFSDRLRIPDRMGLENFPNRFVLRMQELNPDP